MRKIIKNIFIIFIVGYLVAFFLIYLTFLLPSNRVWENIDNSNIVNRDFDSFFVNDSYSFYIDYYSDMHIIGELYYRNNNYSTLKKSMFVYGPSTKPIEQTKEYIENKDNEIFIPYYRYWHGNLFIFKILLSLFNYDTIIIISFILQIMIIGLIIKYMIRKNLRKYIFAFITSLLLINPFIMSFSLQYYPCYFIMLISVLFVLKHENYLLNGRLFYYFFIIGMMTNYFDFLSFPLLTLGIPLIFVYILNINIGFKNICICILLWGLGYFGLWFMKWLTISLIYNFNAFYDVFDTIVLRTSAYNCNRFIYFIYPFVVYGEPFLLLLLICLVIYYIYTFYKEKTIIGLSDYKNNYLLFIIMLIPIIWFLVLFNHSYVHLFLSHRIVMIIFFGFQCFLINILHKN